MNKIALSIVLLLITVANSQRLFYVKCGDGNSSPGYFVFGENGTLLHAWFEKIISNVHMTAIYNYLDGLFYTQTFTGYQIDNPATQSVVTTINSPWSGYGYAIDVRAVDSTQFDIVSGTAQGLYTYNSKTSQFTMVNNGTDYDAFETVAVSPLTNAIYARRKAPAGGVYAVNGTDGSLRLIKEDWITFQMFGDPLDKDNLYVSQYNSGTDSVRTLDVNAGVTQPLYNHEVATFTLSPDGFSYALAFCCTTDTTLRRYDARNGLPFAEDNNFGFDVKQPILNYTGESDASYRYMTVLWSPPRVDLCSIGGSKSISMQFKRYNWTADMELQVSNLFEPIFRTVETVTSSIYMEETVIKSFNLTLYKNASTLYRFRIKYIGRIQWTGYSVHKEMTISASSFDAVTPCPNDFITAPNPPITTSVPVAEPVQEFTPEAPEAPGASMVAPAVIIPIVGSAAIAVLVILLIRRRNKKRAKKNVESKDESMHDTTYSPIAAIAGKRDITVTNPLNVTPPRGDRMNIPRDSLVIGTEIGKGSYGRVYLGEWNSTTVAIKVATTAGTSTFEKELELMLHLTPHPNVLQILGYSYEGVLPLLVLEYCNGGGLDKIIFDQSRPLSVVQQLNLIAGIARGILHLHNNNVVHRDIAARNVLLSSAGEPKVADFGFSRVVEAAGGQTDSTVGPVCWMAPESLRSQKYSFKTDVWSFGVLMYEILARQEPYKGMSVLDVGPKIRDEGITPNESVIDGSVPQELRDIMKSCWKMDPDERPSFTDICTKLDGLKKDFNLTDRVVGQPTSPNLRELVNETKKRINMEEVKEVFSNKSTKIARIRNIFILTMLNGENKFNPSFMTDLNSALDYVEKCPDGVALVTTGGQEKFYSTGLDIPYLMSVGQDAKALSDFMVQFQSLIARILVFPVPTVAAINGHCYAGAAFFALAHDYRVMRKDRGFFCLPEIDLKLAVPPGLMDLLKAKVSDPAYLRELIIYGNKVGGVEAHKMGVIDGAASSSQVLVESIAMVQGLASKDKATLKALKIELYSPAYKKLLAAELGQAEKNFSPGEVTENGRVNPDVLKLK